MTLEQLANVTEFLGLLIVAVTLVFLTTRIRQYISYRSTVDWCFVSVRRHSLLHSLRSIK